VQSYASAPACFFQPYVFAVRVTPPYLFQACKHGDEAARISSPAAAIDAALSNRFSDVDASLAAYDGQVHTHARRHDTAHAEAPRFIWGFNLPC
jgi:hypothetical protein